MWALLTFMDTFVYNTLLMIFGGGMIVDISDFLGQVITALQTLFANNVSTLVTTFSVIAGSLMIIFLYIDLTSNATKELLTLERLVLTFIKFFVAMVILIYLPEILDTLFNLAKGIYDMACDKFTYDNIDYGIRFFPNDGNSNPSQFPDFETIKDALKDAGYSNKVTAVIKHISEFIPLLLVNLVFFVAKAAAYLITVSNAIMVIVRAVLAPLGIVQLFDDGQRSNGIRYLKKFVGEALTFAAIVGILYAASLLQGQLIASVVADSLGGELSVDNIADVLNLSTLVPIVIIQLSAAGAIMKATQLSNDIVGAH